MNVLGKSEWLTLTGIVTHKNKIYLKVLESDKISIGHERISDRPLIYILKTISFVLWDFLETKIPLMDWLCNFI